jgi:hypothetical protein
MLFISFTIFAILVLMTTFAHKTTCTQYGKHGPPTTLVMAMQGVYNMDETGLFYCAQPNKKLRARAILWVQYSKGLSQSCSYCEHDKH